MIESKNHIDTWIEKSLDQATIVPSDRFWQKADNIILSRINTVEKARVKKWRRFAFLFSGLALLFLYGALHLFINQSNAAVTSAKAANQSLQNPKKGVNLAPQILTDSHQSAPLILPQIEKGNKINASPVENMRELQTSLVERTESVLAEEALEIDTSFIRGRDLYTLSLLSPSFKLSSNEPTVRNLSRKPTRPFTLSVYGSLGECAMKIQDNRSTDAQVTSDVAVKNRLMQSFGLEAEYRFTHRWGLSLGLEQTATKTGINSYFFADTTGTGVIVEPEEGEEEEGEGEIGTGNTTVQSSGNGYDIVTNLGLVHLTHPKNVDCTLLASSYQELKYLSIPVQMGYTLPMRGLFLSFKVGGVYHHLTSSAAQLRVNSGTNTIIQSSSIDGLRSSFLSGRVSAGLGVKMSAHWTMQVGCEFTKGLSTINSSTPFGTRMHTFAGRMALSYNF